MAFGNTSTCSIIDGATDTGNVRQFMTTHKRNTFYLKITLEGVPVLIIAYACDVTCVLL